MSDDFLMTQIYFIVGADYYDNRNKHQPTITFKASI